MAGHKALGRGLDALFSTTQTRVRPEGKREVENLPPLEKGQEVKEIPLDKIKPNRHQPRTNFSEEALSELAESIKLYGIAQPLVVSESVTGEEFELVMGERRLRAAKMAQLGTVPCLVKKITNRERFELALIENLQREDLNAMEEAIAIDGLMKEFDLTQDQVAVAIGKSRSTIANVLRFLRLHEDVQAALRGGQISEGHAKCLAGVAEHSDQLRLLEKIIKNKLTVRDLEAELQGSTISKKVQSVKESASPLTPETKEYEEEFQRILGRRVEIQSKGKKGWIRFAFYSPWDLEILCQRLGLLKDNGEVNEETMTDGG